MISRNLIRIKVMQALYEYNMSAEPDLKSAEKKLLSSFSDIYSLYVKILAIFVPLTLVADQVIEIKKNLYLAKEEDLFPNTKFRDNLFIQKIGASEALQKAIKQYHAGWENDVEMVFVRKLFDSLTHQPFYVSYMQDPEISFSKDKEFVLKMLEEFLLENEMLIHYFGEIKLQWELDYNDVIILVFNTLKGFKESQDQPTLPPLFKISEDGASEDRDFMVDLFRNTITENAVYEEIIVQKLHNWEVDRIAAIDFVLLKMAICEFCHFPSIPLRVTFNEYIEISKYYSTPKSRSFINGLLDNILIDLKSKEMIHKQGRGLMG